MKKIFFVLTVLCVMQCSDVIVPDISEDLVLLRAPQDGTQLIGNTVNLSWEALPDAIDYRVELATPDFTNIQQLIVDSITTALNLRLSLSPGSYQWRVTAFNEAYASACCEEYSFQLLSDEGADLSSLNVVLQSPAANAITNLEMVNYAWQVIDAATNYRFQLSTQSNFVSPLIDTLLEGSSFLIDNLQEQVYYWRVRAESNVSNTFTNYSSRQFTIDRTAPPAPVLVFPEDNTTLDIDQQEADFRWTSGTSSQTDTLYIYADIFLDQLLWKLATDAQNINIDTMSVNFETGDYYWNTRSVDAAQNVSAFSESRKFVIQ